MNIPPARPHSPSANANKHPNGDRSLARFSLSLAVTIRPVGLSVAGYELQKHMGAAAPPGRPVQIDMVEKFLDQSGRDVAVDLVGVLPMPGAPLNLRPASRYQRALLIINGEAGL